MSDPQTVAVLSVGSNLGDRMEHLTSVVDSFRDAGELVAASPVYRTPPWGGVEQDDFYNVTVIVAGPRSAQAWLRRGADLEAAAERRRDVRWGPRTLDVDVITVQDGDGHPIFSATEELTLPHPRTHERAFVLIPWLAVDPGAVLDRPDGTSSTVADLVAGLEAEQRAGIEILDDGPSWTVNR